MKIIRELISKNKIRQETLKIVSRYIDESTLEKLARVGEKQARKKVEQLIQKMKRGLVDYVVIEKMGIYGKSKVLKTAQDRLLELGVADDLANSIVKKLMMS